jgi:O-acetyl-ADP-ribose deacetylase (regulator of RNase III)
LRRRGAWVRDGRYVDTIQVELDRQLGDRSRPVQPGEVFVTSTGVPHSDLARDLQARYIFHVAAVQALAAERRIEPLKDPDDISLCVRSCLGALADLNDRDGVVSPAGTEQHREQQRVAAAGGGRCRSILFPMLGTGQGGLSSDQVITPMIDGIRRYLERPDQARLADALDDIYIAVFLERDVTVIVERLKGLLG